MSSFELRLFVEHVLASDWIKFLDREFFAHRFLVLGRRVEAVSYTHLDVYKRQASAFVFATPALWLATRDRYVLTHWTNVLGIGGFPIMRGNRKVVVSTKSSAHATSIARSGVPLPH